MPWGGERALRHVDDPIDPVWAARLMRVRTTIFDDRNTREEAAWRAAGWTDLGLVRL